ncbi:PpiC-type peptidyl-prolyl cis-trans isomerase [Alkalidesulfovibrio alkalitolerans DSM 16529]|uniref:Periplasmic chaperone PpiD n=1 Tax=Alkalidesulfovibrio alkalitolerans DSM 16529 TaxID=1121439 RepID=S7UAQ5_9BACT|nr:SurA N-terminal domain-containing protein [Alkalidesulfovibrio alkalitolerans]EPR31024.1 PpiC-type peptidyl-prolyl cis-trans isomerase [Alkalidesulfovibrio alkalitolerans DSM 16529]
MLEFIRRNAQGWGVKIIFALIILVFVFWGVGSFNETRTSVVAYVDDMPITVGQYKERHDQELERIRMQFGEVSSEVLGQIDFRRQVLEQLVDQRLMERAAAKAGIVVSDAQVRDAIFSITAFHDETGRFNKDVYNRLLLGQHMTPSQFEESVRQSLVAQNFVRHVAGAAVVTESEAKDMFTFAREQARAEYVLFPADAEREGIEVTDEEAQAFYTENEAAFATPAVAAIAYVEFTPESLAKPDQVSTEEARAFYDAAPERFGQEEMVRARHILLTLDANASAEEEAAVLKKITDLRARIKNLDDFAATAQRSSQCPSAPGGGDLGWFGRGAMVEPFEKAAFSLAPGVVSEPVRTRFGYHLIMIEEKREAGIPAFEEVRDEIARQLAEDKAEARIPDLLDEALARLASGEKLATVADQLGLPLRETEPFSRDQGPLELPLSDRDTAAVFALPQGGATLTPLQIADGFALAEKTLDRPASIRPFEEVRATIVAEVTRRKAAEKAAETARTALADIAAAGGELPASLATRARITEPFTRQGQIPGLGSNEMLAEAVFTAPGESWLGEPVAVAAGALIARRVELIAPSEADWESQKGFFLETLEQRKLDEMLRAVIDQLRAEAKVEITDRSILQ